MGQWNMLYDMYERRLKAELSDAAVPKHIGVILDGNRRWAKSLGATASQGHRAGAGKISESSSGRRRGRLHRDAVAPVHR